MSASVTVFFLTGAVVFCVHLSYQVPFYRAVSKLRAGLKQHGIDWSYWRDWRLRVRFHSDATAIFSDSDTPDIRSLKEEVVQRRDAIFKSLQLMIKIMLIGMGLSVVAGLIQ